MSSNEQPVVQTILESFTRCFSPSDHSCGNPDASRSKSPKHVRRGSKMSSSSSPTRAASRLELNNKEWDDVFENKNRSNDSRRRRSSSKNRKDSSSGSESGSNKDVDYTDVVARAKKAAHRLDPETIEQRSLKRKLEIFRTRDSSSGSMSRGGGQSQPAQTRAQQKQNSRKQARVATPEELVLSDSSEEEIANLTSSRKRFACGFGNNDGPMGISGPMASFAKFFSLGGGNSQSNNPFGLCFATPVRTASAEQADKFTDDQLTADEFISRHANNPTVTPGLEISHDGSESVSRMGEDDTITSTLYFDQKYAHIIQTRPPMPLFPSQAVPCEDYRSDDLTRIINKKHLQRSPGRGHRGTLNVVKPSPSPPRPSPSPSAKSASFNKHSHHQHCYDAPPSPAQVSDKSSSSSSPSPGNIIPNDAPWRMRDPDIMHNSAAEI